MVTIADDDFPVVVELDDELIRLSSAGTEIGQWHADECEIAQVGETTYTISAEGEMLEFVPSQPELFAAALNGDQQPAVETDPPQQPDVIEGPSEPLSEAPPPKPLTMGLFYGLCAVTAALALWSLISMIL